MRHQQYMEKSQEKKRRCISAKRARVLRSVGGMDDKKRPILVQESASSQKSFNR